MTIPILQTKLYVDASPPNQVPRLRLYQRLNEGAVSGHRLTLLSAPPGSGKTTLLSGWLAHTHQPAAWLSLDANDNEPTRFWAYMIAALQAVIPGLYCTLPQPHQKNPISSLLNKIAALRRQVVIILDDYHAITSPVIHEDVTVFLERMPPSCHIILSTRVDPPLPIARLRVRGQLIELRSDDLRFTPQEAAVFLNERMDLHLLSQDIDALETRTEGWIAGLQLAALAIKSPRSVQDDEDPHEFIAAFSGSHHYLQEYLTEEVINRQAESVQAFLLQTSILDRLNGSLCAAVTGNPDSTELLTYLERNNLFTVALDDKQCWYRYHQLFADSLRQRLTQNHSAEQVSELHRRASAWLESHGSVLEAIKHALEAQDFECVARLAEQATRASVLDSRMKKLLEWMKLLPEVVLHAHPRLRVYQAWALLLNGQFAAARQMFGEIRQALESLVPGPENDDLRNESEILLDILETLASGFMQGFDGNLTQAIEAYDAAREKALVAGIVSLVAIATEGLALAYYDQGKLRQSAQTCREIIDLGRRTAAVPLPMAAAGHIELAGIYQEWDDRENIERHLNLGMALCRHSRDTSMMGEAYQVQSRLYQSMRDLESAFEAVRQGEQVLTGNPYSLTQFRLDIQWINLCLSDNRLDEAVQRLDQLNEIASRSPFQPGSLLEMRLMLCARVFLMQNKPQDALAILDGLAGPAETAGRFGHLIRIFLLQALALWMLGNKKSALDLLEKSLVMAEPGGYTRLYLDLGETVRPLLQQAAERRITPAYVRRLLAAWKSETLISRSSEISSHVESLTPAEIKVLQLIVNGCSNLEIAEELVITLNTVKRHTNHVYQKLNVRSRTQAIVRARQLGLVSFQPVL